LEAENRLVCRSPACTHPPNVPFYEQSIGGVPSDRTDDDCWIVSTPEPAVDDMVVGEANEEAVEQASRGEDDL
jgi:hypothetical protein